MGPCFCQTDILQETWSEVVERLACGGEGVLLLRKLRQVAEHQVPRDLGIEWRSHQGATPHSTAAVPVISPADLFPTRQAPSPGI